MCFNEWDLQKIQEGPVTINFNQDPSYLAEEIRPIGHLFDCTLT